MPLQFTCMVGWLLESHLHLLQDVEGVSLPPGVQQFIRLAGIIVTNVAILACRMANVQNEFLQRAGYM